MVPRESLLLTRTPLTTAQMAGITTSVSRRSLPSGARQDAKDLGSGVIRGGWMRSNQFGGRQRGLANRSYQSPGRYAAPILATSKHAPIKPMSTMIEKTSILPQFVLMSLSGPTQQRARRPLLTSRHRPARWDGAHRPLRLVGSVWYWALQKRVRSQQKRKAPDTFAGETGAHGRRWRSGVTPGGYDADT